MLHHLRFVKNGHVSTNLWMNHQPHDVNFSPKALFLGALVVYVFALIFSNAAIDYLSLGFLEDRKSRSSRCESWKWHWQYLHEVEE